MQFYNIKHVFENLEKGEYSLNLPLYGQIFKVCTICWLCENLWKLTMLRVEARQPLSQVDNSVRFSRTKSFGQAEQATEFSQSQF